MGIFKAEEEKEKNYNLFEDESKEHDILVDVYENDDNYLVFVDCPGITKDNIALRLFKHKIILRLIDVEDLDLDFDPVLIERKYKSSREIDFEHALDTKPDSVNAALQDGVLTITIKKTNDDADGVAILIK